MRPRITRFYRTAVVYGNLVNIDVRDYLKKVGGICVVPNDLIRDIEMRIVVAVQRQTGFTDIEVDGDPQHKDGVQRKQKPGNDDEGFHPF